MNNPVTLNDPTGGWVQISPMDSYWDNIIESVEGPRVVHTGGTGGGGIMASEGTRFGFTKVDGDGGGRSSVWGCGCYNSLMGPYSPSIAPGSGNHWSDGFRSVSGNYGLMFRSEFERFYGVDLNSDEGRAKVAEALAGRSPAGTEVILRDGTTITSNGDGSWKGWGWVLTEQRGISGTLVYGPFTIGATQGEILQAQQGDTHVLQAGAGMSTDEFRNLLDGMLITAEGYFFKQEVAIEKALKSGAKGERHMLKSGLKNVRALGTAAGVLAVGVSWWEASEKGTTGAYSLATLDTIVAGATLFCPALAPIALGYGAVRLGLDLAGVDVAGEIDNLIK